MKRTKAVNQTQNLPKNKSKNRNRGMNLLRDKKRRVMAQARMLLAGRGGTTENPINNEITIKVNNVKTEDKIKIVGKSVRTRENYNCIKTEYKTGKNIRQNPGACCTRKIIDKIIVTV